jgi:CHAT domain-containing protein
VLKLIRKGTYLHFACHGTFEPLGPLASRVELSKAERLELRDFLDGSASGLTARLAVLSACQAAISDLQALPDEFIGLASGLIQAGVPGVAGTLWSVADLSTALLVVKFYELYFTGKSMSPAEALRRAQLWLRDVTNVELAKYLKESGHERLLAEFGQIELARLEQGPRAGHLRTDRFIGHRLCSSVQVR